MVGHALQAQEEHDSDQRSRSPEVPEEDTEGSGRRARRRSRRQPLSCAECRRLKLKCDRTGECTHADALPCANCSRRNCASICPDGARQPTKATQEETHDLKARLDALEGLLRCSGIDPSGVLPPSGHGPPAPAMVTAGKQSNKRVRLDENPPHIQAPQSGPRDAPSQKDAGAFGDERCVPQQTTTHQSATSLGFDQPYSSAFTSDYNEPDPVLAFDFESDPISENSPQPTWPADRPTAAAPQTIRGDPLSYAPGTSSGTLVISDTGASKYFGHTAGSEWLKDQELHDSGDSQSRGPSRLASPEPTPYHGRDHQSGTFGMFPFGLGTAPSITLRLLSALPERSEAQVLMSAYYRYFAWHFDVAPRSTVQALFDKMYDIKESGQVRERVDGQKLALLFIIFAMGALHSLELPPNDPSSEEYLDLAKRSLAKTDFLTNSTIAGVQTLHIMAHYHLETEKGRNGDSAWPLWGIAMRLMQAMGLHRDGSKWNLSQDVVEERRRVFWECYAADIFQANCFSRPSAIAPQYIDTAFPERPVEHATVAGARHDHLKFELSRISAQVLDHAMRVDTPPYSGVTELHEQIISFERRIPYALRCRAVLLALPSIYPDSETAVRESPEVSRKDLTKTLQQFTLALNVSEALLFLHRPYFARALHERKPDPTQTSYGQSYLCVVERCNVMIQICSTIYPLHPGVIARHWYFWYHVFNAAVCMGTLILQNPRNLLAPLAMSLINSAINLYTNIVQSNPTGRLLKNLEWLLRLRQRANARMSTNTSDTIAPENGHESEEEDIELLGWRTRLVSRLGKGAQTAVTITPTQSTTTPSPNTAMTRTITQALQRHFVPDDSHVTLPTVPAQEPPTVQDPVTDAFLHQFWDPMMLQDSSTQPGDLFPNIEWWNADTTAGTEDHDRGLQ